MDVLVTSKNKENPNKNEGASLAKTQNNDNTQGLISPQSEVKSGQNSNFSVMLQMLLLLPSIKKIRIKMKALERPQHLILIFTQSRADNSAVKGRI